MDSFQSFSWSTFTRKFRLCAIKIQRFSHMEIPEVKKKTPKIGWLSFGSGIKKAFRSLPLPEMQVDMPLEHVLMCIFRLPLERFIFVIFNFSYWYVLKRAYAIFKLLFPLINALLNAWYGTEGGRGRLQKSNWKVNHCVSDSWRFKSKICDHWKSPSSQLEVWTSIDGSWKCFCVSGEISWIFMFHTKGYRLLNSFSFVCVWELKVMVGTIKWLPVQVIGNIENTFKILLEPNLVASPAGSDAAVVNCQ